MRDPPNPTEMLSFSRKLLEGNIFHGKKWPSEHFENAFQTPFVLMQLRGCQVELPTFGGAQRGRIHAVGEWTVRQGCFIIFIMRLQVKVIKKTSPVSIITGCWFQICFIFTPKIGEDEPSLTIIFCKWVVQPPTRSRCWERNDQISTIFMTNRSEKPMAWRSSYEAWYLNPRYPLLCGGGWSP